MSAFLSKEGRDDAPENFVSMSSYLSPSKPSNDDSHLTARKRIYAKVGHELERGTV